MPERILPFGIAHRADTSRTGLTHSHGCALSMAMGERGSANVDFSIHASEGDQNGASYGAVSFGQRSGVGAMAIAVFGYVVDGMGRGRANPCQRESDPAKGRRLDDSGEILAKPVKTHFRPRAPSAPAPAP